MGEIAEMMLDGTMDFETGEFNFDGRDGPGFPMTRRQAERYATPHNPKAKSRRATKGFKSQKSRSPFVCQVPLTVDQLAELAPLISGNPQLARHFARYAPKALAPSARREA